MAACSVVPLRSSDVKKAQTNPSADPDSSDQGGNWEQGRGRGGAGEGPPPEHPFFGLHPPRVQTVGG